MTENSAEILAYDYKIWSVLKQKEPNMAEEETVVAEMAKMLKALITDRQQR